MDKKKIYCFDFDGTLTTRDTLIEFIRYAKGSARLIWTFLLYSPLLVLMKLRLYPNYKAKQKIFAHLFGGMPLEDFDRLCRDFAAANPRLMRPAAIDLLFRCREQGERVLVVSASVDNWVRPFMEQLQLNNVEVLGTQVEVSDGHLTGRFKTKNCYGQEKVRRICEALKREEYYIAAYGDSRGDKEMLAFADEGHYKPFREEKNGKLGEVIRFGIVGGTATLLQYGIYLALMPLLARMDASIGDHAMATTANTVAYIVSFAFNFVASTHYTFRVKANAKRGMGFTLSHIVNYTLQTLFLNVFVGLGLVKQLAMVPTLCICIPINFLLVRFFLKR